MVERQSIGIVLNLSLLTTVTRRVPTVVVKEIVESSENLIFINDYSGVNNKTKVLLNGILMGFAIDPYDFLDEMKSFRSSGMLNKDVSFTFDTVDNELRIFCDEGRLIRPVFTVNDNNELNIKELDYIDWEKTFEKLLKLSRTKIILKDYIKYDGPLEDLINKYYEDITDYVNVEKLIHDKYAEYKNLNWNEFVDKEHVQYVDNSEVENSVIAMDDHDLGKFKCNYEEIHPSMMLGVMGSAIPFPDHSQCFPGTEQVYMYDGTTKSIQDVKIGDKVITFDPETQKQSMTTVINTNKKINTKDVYTMTTISNRKITSTSDHRYMTYDGWKELDEIEINKTLVGISLEPKPVSTEVDEYIILNKDLFIKYCTDLGIKTSYISLHYNNIKHLLPLMSTSVNVPILARLFGFILTDGSASIYEGYPRFSASFGNHYSYELFEQDIVKLGFNKNSSRFVENTEFRENGTKRFGSCYNVQHSGGLASLIITLGMVCGRRSTQKACKIPEWIMKGSNMTKREFLAGFQCGDGSKIKSSITNKQINVQISTTSKTIETKYLNSMLEMMSDIVKIMRDLDINVADPKYENSSEYENRVVVSYYISCARLNLIKYFDIINYRYDVFKQAESGILVEYLKYIQFEYEKRVDLVNKIKSYGSIPRREIAEKLNITVKQVCNILKLTGENIGLPKGLLTVEKWRSIVKIKSTTIFIPIVSKIKCIEDIVYDISVESENYSFLCGDCFCVHNCIFHEEPVYMADGTTKKIEDVKIGDEVITFNPKNQKQTIAKVVHTETHPTEKQLYTITTISGRKITATFDHRFMTSEGWKRLEHLDIDNTLIGISFEPKPVSLDIDEYIILNNKEFIDNCFDAGIHYTKAEKYLEEVKHLLPLKSNSKFLPVISRIFGFCLTDAWIGISDTIGNCRLSADLTSEYGVELFENDVEFLGFKKVTSRFDDRNNGFGSTYRVEHSGYFPALLIALGITYGKKTTKKACKIPTWIMNGSDMVKREFLSGFHGGDGSKIKSGSDKQINIQIGEVTKTIEPKYLQSLCDMMNDIVSLLRYFNINIEEDAKTKQSKDYENRMVVSYYISSARINLIKFFELINYRYDIYKQVESGICIEYLKYLDFEYNKRIQLVNTIKSYGNRNRSEIAKELNITVKDVYNILKLNGAEIGLPKGLITYKTWKKMIKISSSTIFLPIRSIEKSKENIISDITIDSENQSFLCGDTFCVHNSPRNLYQSSMGKQAIGIYALSHQLRTDTITHVLDYPQKPLVNTTPAGFLGFNDMPAGTNVIVAIACYTGFNQEDSVLLNKSAIERGLFVTTSYRTLVDEEKKQGTYNFETIGLPPIEKRKRNVNYSFLDENGIVKKRINGQSVYVDKGDVIIGKTLTKSNKNGEEEILDCSFIIKNGEEGFVDRVIETVTPNGYKMVKVVIRNKKMPEIGDKFASRAA